MIDFKLINFNDNIRPNYWFFSFDLESSMSQEKFIQYFDENHIQSRPIWRLIHKQKPYEENPKSPMLKANYYEKNIVNLPCSSNLTEKDIYYIVSIFEKLKEKKDLDL